MEYKNITLAIKAVDEATGMIEGYASTFNDAPDSYGDVIAPGAFAASIATRKPKMLFDHDTSQPIGVWDEVREDERGLFVRGRFADTEQGRDVRTLVTMGALDSMSIGFRINDSERVGNTRLLTEIDLYEVSIVAIPANPSAKITDAKRFDEYAELIAELNIRAELLKTLCKGFKK